MPAWLSLPKISTNVGFVASALLFPELAGAWAERLFLTPPRNGAAAALDLVDARSSLFEHKGRHIATWRWGSSDAPAVILAHGWGGKPPQRAPFRFPILAAGYHFIGTDQPTAGTSAANLTAPPALAQLLPPLPHHPLPPPASTAHPSP